MNSGDLALLTDHKIPDLLCDKCTFDAGHFVVTDYYSNKVVINVPK